jgi:hypothetical protein
MSDERDDESTARRVIRRIFIFLGGLLLAAFLIFGLCTLAMVF